jgi:LPS O-antigen subunit length determinant protein (WzzB/FepE family)
VWELGRFTPLRQILGESHSLEKLKVILESRILVKGVVEKENLLPILYSKYWDKENSRWRINEPPSYLDAWSLFKKRLKVRMKKGGTMQVSFEANSPHLAKKILEGCLRELSEILRDGVIREAVQNQRFLKEQIKKTPDALLREKLYHLLASEVERETLARAQRYYGFTVLDPPLLPKRPSGPKRLLMVSISFTMSAFAGVFLAFFLNYLSSRSKRV